MLSMLIKHSSEVRSCYWKVSFFPLNLKAFSIMILRKGLGALSTVGNVRKSLYTAMVVASCCWKVFIAAGSVLLTPAT